MTDFYEEIIQQPNFKEEEIQNFYINEKLSEIDKITYILKKGYPIQKSVLIGNIPFYYNKKEALGALITLIIEYIEIWCESLQSDFCKALAKLYTTCKDSEILYNNTKDIVNSIIKIVLKIIVTGEQQLSDEFLRTFEDITEFYSNFQKVKVDTDIIENVTGLGAFGKPNNLRRLSAFLSCSILKIATNPTTDLFSRIWILSTDSDRAVKLIVVNQFKYIIKELEEATIKKNIFHAIENCVSDDDLTLKLESIHSFLEIYNNFPDENLLTHVNKELLNIYEDKLNETTEGNMISTKESRDLTLFTFLKKIFISLIHLDTTFTQEENKTLQIKNAASFLTNFVINSKYPFENSAYEFLIEEFNYICKLIKNKNSILLIDLLCFIVNKKNFINLELFLRNLSNILDNFDKEIQNKYVLFNLLTIVENFDLKNPLPNPDHIKTITLMVDHMNSILIILSKFENFEIMIMFANNFPKLDLFTFNSCINWRSSVKFIQALYKNEFVFNINETFVETVFEFCKNHFKREIYPVQVELMKLSAAAMKYSNQFFQHDILKYIKSEVMDNSNFFKRRLYLSFLEHCIELFSVGYLTEIGILTNFSNFLTFTDTYDANKLTIQKALNLLKYFLPFISVEKTNDNLNFAIFNKLSYIRKYQKDQEVLKSVSEFDSWYAIYKKNSKNSEYEELIQNDSLKYKDELKFFNREVDYVVKKQNRNEDSFKTKGKSKTSVVYKSEKTLLTSQNKLKTEIKAGLKTSSKSIGTLDKKKSTSIKLKYSDTEIISVKSDINLLDERKPINRNTKKQISFKEETTGVKPAGIKKMGSSTNVEEVISSNAIKSSIIKKSSNVKNK